MQAIEKGLGAPPPPRNLSTSCAALLGVLLSEICAAATWATPCTSLSVFTHYFPCPTSSQATSQQVVVCVSRHSLHPTHGSTVASLTLVVPLLGESISILQIIDGLQNFLHQKQISLHCSPSLAGDDTHFLTVPMWGDTASLPPLIIRGIDDMEDVPVPEAEPLAGEAAVL